MTASVALLDLEFADLDTAAAARWIAERPVGARFGYVVTPNADHLMRLGRDPALLAVYRRAALRLLDSRVVARTARALDLPAPQVVPGSDLTARLLLRHVRPGERIVIIGLRREWLPKLMARCGLSCQPWHFDPPIGFEHDPAAFDAVVRFVLAHQARFVFLAVGSPRQERLAAAIAATGQATGTGLCIGASLEFLAGAARRAPPWMQQAGLEWLFRLLGDPRRLASRYLLDDPGILLRLLQERLRGGNPSTEDAADGWRRAVPTEQRPDPEDPSDPAGDRSSCVIARSQPARTSAARTSCRSRTDHAPRCARSLRRT